MDHIGIDIHKRDSQIYILADGGEVVEQRIRTEPERFAAITGAPPALRQQRWNRPWNRGGASSDAAGLAGAGVGSGWRRPGA